MKFKIIYLNTFSSISPNITYVYVKLNYLTYNIDAYFKFPTYLSRKKFQRLLLETSDMRIDYKYF